MADKLFYITYHEDEDKIQNGIARLIYAYMCRIARFKPQTYLFKGKIDVQLGLAQLATSTGEILDHLNDLEIKLDKKKCLSMIQQLQDLELITIETIKKGNRNEGSIVTVLSLKNYLESIKEPKPALQPQGIQPFTEPPNVENEPRNEPQTEPRRALQPQGIQQFEEPRNEPPNEPRSIKVIKNLSNKDLNNIKEQQKIAQPESIVNTFSTAFNYILTRFENEFLKDKLEANEGQIKTIRQFAQQMEPDLLEALFNEAAEGARKNPVTYFFQICRESLTKGITTLDKKLQNAALYRQRTGTDGRQQQTGRQLSPKDTSGNFDNLPF